MTPLFTLLTPATSAVAVAATEPTAATTSAVTSTPAVVAVLILGAVTLFAATAVVFGSRLVRTAFWLVLVFLGQAGVFVTLGADFLGWVQILISVGAVVVLVLFGLMLTSVGSTSSGSSAVPPSSGWRRLGAAAVALTVTAVLGTASLWALPQRHLPVRQAHSVHSGSAQTVGQWLFSSWVWPFEVLSVLLLVALVGAIAVSQLRQPIDAGTAAFEPAVAGTTASGSAAAGKPAAASLSTDLDPASESSHEPDPTLNQPTVTVTNTEPSQPGKHLGNPDATAQEGQV